MEAEISATLSALHYVTLDYKFNVHLQNKIEQQTLQCHTMQVQRFTMKKLDLKMSF